MNKSAIDLQGSKILIVDDTPENLKILRQTLESEGYSILVATNGEAALKLVERALPDLILLDVMMPGINGFETCHRLKANAKTQDIPVIFITARAETEAIVEGFHVGGVDYIVKPFQNDEVIMRVRAHLQINRLTRELVKKNDELHTVNEQLRAEIARREMIVEREVQHWGIDGFIGESKTIRETLTAISRLQNIETTVLITGESGTGKELIARAIHHGSPRASGAFVPVNCSAIPKELAESMLFGHVRGAFTGAEKDRTGYFELASGGTLFLDEVGDMPLDIQAKILRVLEDGIISPIGGTKEIKVSVRVLAATNVDIESSISRGTFRQDLYFRLARFLVRVPPLRERPEDIPLLAQHFLNLFATEMRLHPPSLTAEAIEKLIGYDFPGNVRELKNMIERAVIENNGGPIQAHHLYVFQSRATNALAQNHDHTTQINTLPFNLKEAEEFLILRAFKQTKGNIAATARLLGTNRPRIYKFLEDHPDFSAEK